MRLKDRRLWGVLYMGGCQNYGPFLGARDPERDHNVDNYPYVMWRIHKFTVKDEGAGHR